MRLHRLAPLALLLIATGAQAEVRLVVRGVDESLRQTVTDAVALSHYAQREPSQAQLQRLLAQAPAQARAALAPCGYYDAQVSAQWQPMGKDGQVTLTVVPGAPVTVRSVQLQLAPAAAALAPVRRALRALERLHGQRLQDAVYEQRRDALTDALVANGYLDAHLLTHRVEVHRAEHRASIQLAWQAGTRYRYGAVQVEGSPLGAGALDRYLPFQPGEPFDQAQLLTLQQALTATDYFAMVNVQPQLATRHDGLVDIRISLQPARRSLYTGGPFLGTDTGYGLRAGMQRRWVNRRGDSWTNELVLAQRLKTLSTLYAIPLPGDDQRSWNLGANLRDADTATSQSHTRELVGNQVRQWHGWTRTLGVHVLTGSFTVGKRGNEPDNTPGIEHGDSTLVYAEAALSRKQADKLDFVQRGWSLSLAARSTAGHALSSARFSELTIDAKWIRAFGARRRNRLILRGSAGRLWSSDFAALPPQLRFFAGGDRSVRGYAYQSIGPRNAADRVIGGANLLVGSAEVEHYFNRDWGIASFLDAGNAFDGIDYRPKLGTGLGLRWRSPIGMLRADLGTPLHDARRRGVVLHLVLGADL